VTCRHSVPKRKLSAKKKTPSFNFSPGVSHKARNGGRSPVSPPRGPRPEPEAARSSSDAAIAPGPTRPAAASAASATPPRPVAYPALLTRALCRYYGFYTNEDAEGQDPCEGRTHSLRRQVHPEPRGHGAQPFELQPRPRKRTGQHSELWRGRHAEKGTLPGNPHLLPLQQGRGPRRQDLGVQEQGASAEGEPPELVARAVLSEQVEQHRHEESQPAYPSGVSPCLPVRACA
jgi:hypothetical protein